MKRVFMAVGWALLFVGVWLLLAPKEPATRVAVSGAMPSVTIS